MKLSSEKSLALHGLWTNFPLGISVAWENKIPYKLVLSLARMTDDQEVVTSLKYI